MPDVFLMLGVGVPVTCCRIFLNEPIRLAQVLGFCLLVAYLFFRSEEQKIADGQKKSCTVVSYIGLMSVFLFLNSCFKTLAAAYLDSAVLYPLTQGTSLLLSVLISAVFFKEKVTPKCIIGALIAFGAPLVINFL